MSLFDKANELAVLAVGRNQEFTTQNVFSSAPVGNFDGVDVREAVKAAVNINLRENAAFMTAVIDIEYSEGTIYEITINGASISIGADTDKETTLLALAENINTDPSFNEIVLATYSATRGLVLTGLTADNFSISAEVAAGDGTISLSQDITTAQNYYIWALVIGVGWALVQQGEVTLRNLFTLIDCAPFDRLYVEIAEALLVKIGKGVLE